VEYWPGMLWNAGPTSRGILARHAVESAHKHRRVKVWLAKRPRWHLHFIPTYSSWLNQVERFFSLITDKAIRRGSFGSVKELVGKIDHFVTQYNKRCKPFNWTATADSVLQKLERLTSRISGTGH
jgi:putative transposase